MRAATYNEVFAFLWRSIISISYFFDCFGNRRHRQLCRVNNGEIVQESNAASLFTAEDKEECTGEECESLIHHVDRSGIEEEILEEEEIVQEISVSSLVTPEDKEESTVTQYENLIREIDQPHIDEELLEQAKFLKACGTLPETPAEIRKVVSFAEKVKSNIKESRSVHKSSAETPDEIQQAQAETSEETQITDIASEDSAKLDPQRPRGELGSSPCSGTLPETPAETRRVDFFAEVELDVKESQSALEYFMETPDEIQLAQAESLPENAEKSGFCILPNMPESSAEASEETLVTESSEDSAKSDAQRPCNVLRSSPGSGKSPETPAEDRKVVLFAGKVEKLDIKESQSLLKSSAETPDEIQHTQAENLPENVEGADFSIHPIVLESLPETSETKVTEPSSEDSAKSDAQRPCSVLRSSPGSGTLPDTPAETRKVVSFAENVEKLDIIESQSVLMSSSDTPDGIQQAREGSDLCVLPIVFESSPETSKATEVTETSSEDSAKSDAQRPSSVLRSSPYPTPRRITDDMQTPGTVYATNMKNLAQGMLQIRSQFVYTVLNPIENLDHQHELKAEKSSEHELPDHEGAYLSEKESITPCSRMNSILVADSSGKENIGSVSLSSWLKPPLSNNDATRHNLGRTTGDKSIIGLVTTDWNEQEETSHSSPKLWDVNGIPNSTSKYKEDQKVHWHSTPFEERLERALSETSSVSLRKPIDGMPIVFEDTEEDQHNISTVVSF